MQHARVDGWNRRNATGGEHDGFNGVRAHVCRNKRTLDHFSQELPSSRTKDRLAGLDISERENLFDGHGERTPRHTARSQKTLEQRRSFRLPCKPLFPGAYQLVT
jgi:hypothetical protein